MHRRRGVLATIAHAVIAGVAVAAMPSCTDALGSHASVASLQVVPDFGDLSSVAVDPSTLHVVLTRVRDEKVVKDTSAAIDPVTGEATVVLKISLENGAEDYRLLLQATRNSDGVVLFEGSEVVTIGPGVNEVPVSVTAVPAGIRVNPGYANLGIGQTATLAANLVDANDSILSAAAATWVARTPAVATVDASTGVLSSVAAGTTVVVATYGSFTDSLLVQVAAAGTVPVSATGNGRAFRSPRVGDTVVVDVTADMSFTGGELLGSYNAELTWNAATLKYVSTATGGFAVPTLNETQTTLGSLRFSAADANGASGAVVVARVRFVAQASGSAAMQLAITELSAAKTFTNLLSSVTVTNGVVTVRP
jgi:hypothetical protein